MIRNKYAIDTQSIRSDTQLQYANQYAYIRMYTQFIYAIHNTQLPKMSIRMIRKYLFPYASIRIHTQWAVCWWISLIMLQWSSFSTPWFTPMSLKLFAALCTPMWISPSSPTSSLTTIVAFACLTSRTKWFMPQLPLRLGLLPAGPARERTSLVEAVMHSQALVYANSRSHFKTLTQTNDSSYCDLK